MAGQRKRKASRRTWGKVRRLPSGNYQASYVGPDERRYTAPMTFSATVDADAWLAIQRSKIAGGTWKPTTASAEHTAQAKSARTFGDYAAQWIEERTTKSGDMLKGTTVAEYRRLLRTELAPLAPLPLAEITPERVSTWRAAIMKSGRKTTAARAYGFLRSVMGTAVRVKAVAENPCTIEGAQNSKTGRKSELPTPAEVAIMEATMTERYRAMVPMAAYGGLRYGELTELRRRDITLDDDTLLISVTRAVTKVPGEGFVVSTPKSERSVRVVALDPRLTPRIMEHLERHAQPGPDGLLFPSRSGGHLPQSSFVKHWYPAREAAGRGDLTWHKLRKFAGTYYTAGGATLAEVMEFLGHSTVTAAMVYQGTTGRSRALASRMMDAAGQ